MPIVDDLDLGAITQSVGPNAGTIGGSVAVVGSRESITVTGRRAMVREQVFIVKALNAIAGQAAGTKAAAKLLATQLQEMVGSSRHILWESGAGTITASPWDGWWRLDDVEPMDFTGGTYIPVRVRATLQALDPSALAVQRFGSPLTTTGYSGAASEILSFPLNAGNQPAAAFSRAGAEGTVQLSRAPATTSSPFTPPATITDLFKGRVRVFDTLVVNGNAIPVGAPASWSNANWVEVFGPDHNIQGDLVMTNGMVAVVCTLGQARALRSYVWVAGTGWVLGPDLVYNDTAGGAGTLRQMRVSRFGWFGARVRCRLSTAAGKWAELGIRLGRPHYFVRVDFKPLSEANTSNYGLALVAPVNWKIFWNTARAIDASLAGDASNIGPNTDYGFAAGHLANAAYPWLAGWLYRVPPANLQPAPNQATAMGFGDNTAPAQGAVSSYAFFVAPYTGPQTLQAEAESGTLNGFVSAVDAAGSAGNAAKLAAASAAGKYAFVTAAITPPAGSYMLGGRVRASAAPTAASEFVVRATTGGTGGASPTTAASLVLGSGSGALGSYRWFLTPAFNLDGATTLQAQFDSLGASAASVDWFGDEWALLPQTLTADFRGPQDLWQQFKADFDYDLVRV